MEGDTHQKSDRKERDISIHSLRMEGDKNFLSMTSCNCIFQSTPSAWRETQERCQIVFPAMDFNPLPPHGGRLVDALLDDVPTRRFQSTPSAWRETAGAPWGAGEIVSISIHSLRMEGDIFI